MRSIMISPNIVSEPLLTPTAALSGKLVAPDTEVPHAEMLEMYAQERLAFRVGPVGILIAANAGREVVPPPPVSRLPHLPVWLLGVANVRGLLLPVVDIGAAFGVKRDKALKLYLLIVVNGDGALGLIVDGLPTTSTWEPSSRMNGVPPHPEFLSGQVSGGYERDGRVWLDTNLDAFLKNIGEQLAPAV